MNPPKKKIIYVYLGGAPGHGGSVQHKVECQVKYLNTEHTECTGWFFTTAVSEETDGPEHVKFIPLKPYTSSRKFFRKFFEKQYFIRQIHEKLKSAVNDADFFYIRHLPSGRQYFRLIRKLGKKLVIYVPSNSLHETYREYQVSPKTTLAGRFFRWIDFVFFTWLPEYFFYRDYTSLINACVAFTPEFATMIRKRSRVHPKVIYNRDGADAAEVPVRQFHPSADEAVKLVFMKGSSTLQPWSGLERLMRSIDACKDRKFELYITGKVMNPEEFRYPFVKLTGRLENAELENLINTADIGVSNLQNYLIRFSETTNLKSREYFMRGLPFIQANSMPDITGTELEKYFLDLPNNAELIDMHRVYDFAMNMRKQPDHPQQMRKLSEVYLDWKTTTGELSVKLAAL